MTEESQNKKSPLTTPPPIISEEDEKQKIKAMENLRQMFAAYIESNDRVMHKFNIILRRLTFLIIIVLIGIGFIIFSMNRDREYNANDRADIARARENYILLMAQDAQHRRDDSVKKVLDSTRICHCR